QNENQLKKSQQAESDYRAKLKQTESVLKNLSGVSYNELIAVQKQLQKELKATTRGTDEHKTKLDQYNRVTREVSKAQSDMNQEIGSNGSMMSKAANGINKYFAMFTAGFAAVTGFTLALKGFMDQRNQLEDSKANLKALTGLGDNDIEWLAKQAKELSTQMTESGVRIRLSSKDIVDGMTIMGSKRPELLKDRDALAAVTKEALILATAGKMEAVPAFEAVAASLNQFGLKSSDASRVINALGAGALAGSAEVNNLSDSMKNVGAVANASNMSLDQTVGALEVLAEKQLVGEEAGTKLRGALLKLKEAGVGYASGSFNFRDALNDVNKKLKDLHDPAAKDALIIKMFGAENVTAGQILLDNVPKYDSMTKAVTGTSVAYEQARINSQTMAAKLAQAKAQFNELGMELVKNLNPAMLHATDFGTLFIKFLVKLPNLIKENATTIIALVSAFSAFLVVTNLTTIALKLMYARDQIVQLGHAIKILSLRVRIALTKEATAAEMALAEATVSSNAAMKSNLWGIIASAIAVALVYLIDWIKKSTELNDAQKIQIAIMDDYKEAYKQNSEAIVKQRTELTSLVTAILNTNDNEQTRSRLIDELNKKYPGFISFIDKEKVTNELLASALADVNEQYDMKLKSIALNSKAQAYENATVKAMQRQIEIQDELNKLRSEPGDHDKEIKKLEAEDNQLNKNIKSYETASSTFRTNAVKNNQEIQAMNTSEYYSKQMDQYKNFLKEVSKKRDEYEAGSERWNYYNEQINQANAAFKYANLKYNEIKKLEDKAKNTNKDKPTTPTTPIADAIAALDNELTEKKNRLKQDRIDGKKDEEKYNAELLDLEVDFLTKKRNLYAKGTKEYNDLDGQIKDIQLNKQKTANEANIKSVEDSYKSIQDTKNIYENTERERLQGELQDKTKTQEQYNAAILALEETLAESRLNNARNYAELIGGATFNSEADKKKAVTAANAAVTAADGVYQKAKANRTKGTLKDEKANLEEIARMRQTLGLDQEKLGYMKSLKALKAHLKEVKATEKESAEMIGAFKLMKAQEYAQ
ncbi:MAG: phage tail tape measure protein, partial [Betaproteobacteria bacterium]